MHSGALLLARPRCLPRLRRPCPVVFDPVHGVEHHQQGSTVGQRGRRGGVWQAARMTPAPSTGSHVDVAIVGGGHNALVAATLLARTGLSVVVLEQLGHVGGAAVSEHPFAGVDARLSRYSYL